MDDVVVVPLHIVGGERRAVGPLVAFAQVESEAGGVVRDFPAFGHVGNESAGIVGGVAGQAEGSKAVDAACIADADRAAVFALLLLHRDYIVVGPDERILGQPFLDGG